MMYQELFPNRIFGLDRLALFIFSGVMCLFMVHGKSQATFGTAYKQQYNGKPWRMHRELEVFNHICTHPICEIQFGLSFKALVLQQY